MPKTESLNPVVPAILRPSDAGTPAASIATTASVRILLALSFCHLLNDTIQALIPAIYPLLKESLRLSFTQIGLITFTFQMAGSVLQPLVGLYTDKHPQPFSLVAGMGVTLVGVILLALAPAYGFVLMAAGCVGLGSAVFHPEASRMARLASGGRHGFAQSLFQVGGNAGSAAGPLLAAALIGPFGQHSILWFSSVALAGMWILGRVGRWYKAQLSTQRPGARRDATSAALGRGRIALALAVLLCLMFSKFIYLASMTSYYTFYLIHRFGVSVSQSQFFLFLFLGAGAAGTLLGGPLGDRIGRKQIIWLSILGVAPFSLALPHVGLGWTVALSMVIALIMASAFPAILVFATELWLGQVGLVAGLFFGLAFGLAGIGSAVLGRIADATSIQFVFNACAYLPLLGLLTGLLPKVRKP